MIYDIIVVGAGASGLSAACQAAGMNRKLKILVLEKECLAGRKLSAAGNGKCNLTNLDFHSGCYVSENEAFVEDWAKRHTHSDVCDFFKEQGIPLYQRNGYFYPMSNQGKQVTELLVERSHFYGVQFSFETRVAEISYGNSVYNIKATVKGTVAVTYQARHLLLATGGQAAPKLGGCRDGYRLAGRLGLQNTTCYPVLCPVYVTDSALFLAKGVRLDAVVTWKGAGEESFREAGQVQFNDNNLSGIVMMNVSCHFNRWFKDKVEQSHDAEACQTALHIDTLPEFTWNGLMDFFLMQKKQFSEETVSCMLCGLFPAAFVSYIVKRVKLENNLTIGSLSEKQMNRLVSTLKKLCFTPVYREDYERAQAAGGGISTGEVESGSFECKTYKNLYVTGELLDVTGKCGGYNLTFAVLSGIAAAKDIVKKCTKE